MVLSISILAPPFLALSWSPPRLPDPDPTSHPVLLCVCEGGACEAGGAAGADESECGEQAGAGAAVAGACPRGARPPLKHPRQGPPASHTHTSHLTLLNS
eukprot:1593452-Rhodomonas_salina.1